MGPLLEAASAALPFRIRNLKLSRLFILVAGLEPPNTASSSNESGSRSGQHGPVAAAAILLLTSPLPARVTQLPPMNNKRCVGEKKCGGTESVCVYSPQHSQVAAPICVVGLPICYRQRMAFAQLAEPLYKCHTVHAKVWRSRVFVPIFIFLPGLPSTGDVRGLGSY
jgi:hypothetical protein